MKTESNDFLPADYEQPKSSGNYMKFQQGENKLRILSKPIIGWIDWKDKKPFRFKMKDKPAAPLDPTKKIKHFWAFIVWDYQENQISILEITQSSIQTAIGSYSKDADWGSPFNYDIKIVRSGDGMETEYIISPVPHKPVSPEIIKAYADKPCNLEALFEGKDPFENPTVLTVMNDLQF